MQIDLGRDTYRGGNHTNLVFNHISISTQIDLETDRYRGGGGEAYK